MAAVQGIESLTGILLGGALGLCYDCYRVLFPCGKAGSIWRLLGDLLWWVFAFFLTFSVLILLNWGELRLFFLLFLAAGFWAWGHFLSHLFRRLLGGILGLCRRILRFCYRLLERILILLCSPIFLLLQLVWKLLCLFRRPFGWLAGKGKGACRFCGNKVKKNKVFQKLTSLWHKNPPEE